MDVDEEQDAWGSHDASQGELGFERKAYGAANLIRHAHRTSQVHPVVSVVSVVFKNPRFVISAGAYDGQLRGWDLRHHGSYHHQPFPIPTLQSVDFTKTSRRHFGLRHMVMSKDHLYVLGMNGKLYEVHSTLFQPTTLYTSSLYLSPTHYTKLSVDPLGRFLAVGSQFPLCLIMELSTRRTFVLDQGYQSEVTQVCFSKKTTSLDLATCSDDATVRIWKEKQLETTSSLSFEPTSMPSSSLSSPSPYASHLASSAWPYHAREVPAEFESNPFQVPSSATFFSTKDKTFQNQNHGSASIQKQRKTTLHEFFS
ncbi:hypothetical protein HMI55_004483 [Coelomomyces lativittatus]|nr:hypothetical protein HMI55_004483 [Coelomomyces lativittatus]